jgi:hypothetical protein
VPYMSISWCLAALQVPAAGRTLLLLLLVLVVMFSVKYPGSLSC